jgi:ribosomal protein S18 acetylase RimI-like enzyme
MRRAMTVTYEPATLADLDALVALRIEAMRESLERIGRFDPARARERFASGFDPACTRHILLGGQRVGFVVVKQETDGLLLDHLYLRPTAQGQGVGARVLSEVLADADARGLPLHVGALRESMANAFYSRHGFQKVGESEWDIYYRRDPA